jgi:aryl-alcohol dehydrogenase-like predicted oxidoreductase
MISSVQYGEVHGVDKPISRLVQGTVMIGSEEADRSFELLDEVWGLGCTAFDTAHQYGAGDSERTFGRWMEVRGIREDVVVIGKGAHHNLDRARVTPYDIAADLFDSLARLRTEYIDLYLLHRDDPSVPVGPIIETLNEHLDAGRIHAFGASNWSTERISEVQEYARDGGLVPFAASSPNLSLAVQAKAPWEGCVSISGEEGKAERQWYAQQEMPLFAWSSLAGGFFSGRFTRENLSTFDTYLDELCVETYSYEDNFARFDRALTLAEARGLSVPQVALAYVLGQPLDVFALVGCKTPEEFADNARAAGVSLTPEEKLWLERGTGEGAASFA